MPVFNAEKFLRLAIESIINQTYQNWELIAVNDGSTDCSLEILTSYEDLRIKALSNPKNLGIVATLNRCMNESHGEFIARMDADDISKSSRLEDQIDYLLAHPECAVVGSALQEIDVNGTYQTIKSFPTSHELIVWRSFFENPIAHPTVLMRKSLLPQEPMYRSDFQDAEDYELWVRITKEHNLANLNLPLLDYRVHSGAISEQRQTNMIYRSFRVSHHAVSQWCSLKHLRPPSIDEWKSIVVDKSWMPSADEAFKRILEFFIKDSPANMSEQIATDALYRALRGRGFKTLIFLSSHFPQSYLKIPKLFIDRRLKPTR